MLTRITILMQITTAPNDRTEADPHTAGWSESYWVNGDIATATVSVQELLTKRALLLPAQGAIVGVRNAKYDIVGNALVPKGASTARLRKAGSGTYGTDQPGVSLMLACTGTNVPNATKMCIRGIPDVVIIGGEYGPDTTFKGRMTQFTTLLKSGWGFVGRDLSQPAQKVISIAGNVVTLAATVGGNNNVDNLIFKKVRDNDGNPVKGSYLMTAGGGTATYTLAGGLNRTKTVPGGTARLDKIAFFTFQTVDVDRAVLRKVGRPFASYRGKASKKAA